MELDIQKQDPYSKSIENEKNIISKTFIVDELIDKLENIQIRDDRRRALKEENKAKRKYMLNGVIVMGNDNKIEGDIILDKMRSLISRRYMTKNQLIIMEILISANLENIYGYAFKDNELRIKKENSVHKIRPYVFVGVPRRNGKTFVVAWFVTVALLYMQNVECVIFAPSRDQTKIFFQEIRASLDFVAALGIPFKVISNSMKEICIRSPCENYYNKILALGSNSDTSRGISANIVIADELSFITDAYLKSVILPLLMVSKTSFIGISTVNGEENHFFKFLSMQDTEDASCPIEVFQFYGACFNCRHKGNVESCKHLINEQPDWISDSRKKDVAKMYKVLGGEDMARQEIMGMVKQENVNAFDENHITRMFDAQHMVDEKIFSIKPSMVYSVIDPTGGGGSDLAIVSFVYDSGRMIIIGLESIRGSSGPELFPHIEAHYRELRKNNLFRDASIGVWVEGNMIYIYHDITNFLSNSIPRLTIFDKTYADSSSLALNNGKGGSTNTGQVTNAVIKQHMWKLTRDHLEFDRIYFYEHFVTVFNPRPFDQGVSARHSVRAILNNQMVNYFMFRINPMNPHTQQTKLAFSGKTSKSEGKDDMAVALQLGLECVNRLISTQGMQKLYSSSINI